LLCRAIWRPSLSDDNHDSGLRQQQQAGGDRPENRGVKQSRRREQKVHNVLIAHAGAAGVGQHSSQDHSHCREERSDFEQLEEHLEDE
jgi:hypothetical protein